MDPNNVLIRCPAGHELQAARTDLGKTLSCPICNMTFTPTAADEQTPTSPGLTQPSGPQSQPQTPPYTPPTTPHEVGYAGSGLGRPAFRPAYAGWLVGLWIAVTFLSIPLNFMQFSGMQNPQAINPVQTFGSCFLLIIAVPAVVLHLMWIYRIHDDARRTRGYQEVSPGLALGLSFIPMFNYIWTGWTMKKLAAFAAREGDAQFPRSSVGLRAATRCFHIGIAVAVVSCIAGIAGGVIGFQAAMRAAPGSVVNPFADIGPGFWLLMVFSTVLSVVGVFVYAWAVLKVQASLYDYLGAPS